GGRDGTDAVRDAVDVDDGVVDGVARVPGRNDMIGVARLQCGRAVDISRRTAPAEMGTDGSGLSLARAEDISHQEEVAGTLPVADEVLAAASRHLVHFQPKLHGVTRRPDLFKSWH